MSESPLIDALNDCIDRLHAGESLDVCLRAHPEHADVLRSLLVSGMRVRGAEPRVPLGARSRVRSQVMQAWTQAEHAPRRSRSHWSGGLLRVVAGVVLLVGVAALLALWWGRDSDQNQTVVVPLTTQPATVTVDASVTPMPTVDASPTLLPSATLTPAATATVSATPTQTPTATSTPTATQTPTATTTRTPTAQLAACRFAPSVSSVSLRAGPGTGYAVRGYGYSTETYDVQAVHDSGLWYALQLDNATVWVAASVGTLSGTCDDLPVSSEQLLSQQSASTPSGSAVATPDDSGGGDDDDHSGSGGGDDDNSGKGSGDDDPDSDDDHSDDDPPDSEQEPDDD